MTGWSLCLVALVCLLDVVSGGREASDEPIGPQSSRHHRSDDDDESSTIRENESRLMPTVFLAILASNQAHLLPQFLAYIERLDYPRERISIGFVKLIFPDVR